MNDIDTTKLQKLIIIFIIVLYILEGILFNPLIIWVASPIIFSFIKIRQHTKNNSIRGLNGAKGFLYTSGTILLLVHLAWFFDLDGTKTGGSTSSLIFAVIPFYAFILGGFAYLIGYKSKPNSNNA